MIPLCLNQGVGLIPWSPLARGFLTGNRPRGEAAATVRGRTDNISHAYYTDGDYSIVDRVREMGERHSVPAAQIALAWLLHKPGISAPIVGASKMQQLEDAVAALEVRLTPAELAVLEDPYEPRSVRGHS